MVLPVYLTIARMSAFIFQSVARSADFIFQSWGSRVVRGWVQRPQPLEEIAVPGVSCKSKPPGSPVELSSNFRCIGQNLFSAYIFMSRSSRYLYEGCHYAGAGITIKRCAWSSFELVTTLTNRASKYGPNISITWGWLWPRRPSRLVPDNNHTRRSKKQGLSL